MKKKLIVVIVIILILITGLLLIINNNKYTKDELKFKREFEKLNSKYLKVNIPKDNNIEYVNSRELVNILKNKKAIILIGSSKNNKTRHIVEVLIHTVKCNCEDKIYYYDIKNSNKEITNLLNKKNNKDKIENPSVIFTKDDNIESLETNNDTKKITESEVKALTKKYKKLIKELEKEDAPTCSIKPSDAC